MLESIKQKIMDTGTQQIAYYDIGEGAPVVLLHGFCGSSAYWEELIPHLASFRIIAPDLRGHGQSSAPEGDSYPMEVFAEDLAALLDHLGLEKAHVFGHSLGGYATLAFAAKYEDRLLSFGLIHSTAYPDSEAGKEGRLKAMQTIREQGLPIFLEGLVPRLFAPDHLKSMSDTVEKVRQIGLKTDAFAATSTLDGMRQRPDRNDVLKAARVPVLLVAGMEDQIVPPERALSVDGEHITAMKLDKAGHMGMMETPRALAKILADFVQAR